VTIQKTDIGKSPLLQPVIERDYTKGISIEGEETPKEEFRPEGELKQETPKSEPQGQATPPPQEEKRTEEEDFTKEFTFEAPPEESASEVGADEGLGGVIGMISDNAKTFANFAGDAIQIYLPQLTYSFVKIDIDNVIINVEQNKITPNWVDVFIKVNQNTEKALAISDESIKMWKKAFKDYLEYEKVKFANPKWAFILATMILLADQTIRAIQIRKQNESFVKMALEKSQPGIFNRKPPEEKEQKPEKDEQSKK